MIKKIRVWWYGYSYRVKNKLIHRFDYCQQIPNPALSHKIEIGGRSVERWSVPTKCSWCGASNNKIVDYDTYLSLFKTYGKRRNKIHRLFG